MKADGRHFELFLWLRKVLIITVSVLVLNAIGARQFDNAKRQIIMIKSMTLWLYSPVSIS